MRHEASGRALQSRLHSAPPPAIGDAIVVRAVEPTQQLVCCARFTSRERYATCNELPGCQIHRGGKSPLQRIFYTLTHQTAPYIYPSRSTRKLKLFSLLSSECGKAGFRVPTLSFNL